MVKAFTHSWTKRYRSKANSQSGVTIIETVVAVALLLVVVVGLLPVFTFGFQVTEQQGDIQTRTSEYAQDKMESLMNLSFTDSASNTASTTFPPPSSGGTGLGGSMAVSTTIGSVYPAASVASYTDYLDFNGTALGATSTGAFYQRQWSITTDSTGNLKTITVSAVSLQKAGIKGLAPSATLVCVKSGLL
jgi:hypothetical protein